MAVVIKGEYLSGSGEIRQDGKNIIISEVYEYHVLAEKTDTRMDVLTAAGLPVVNYTMLASGAKCTSKKAERNSKQPRLWKVTCTYETTPPDQDQNEGSTPDPTTWIPRWRGEMSSYKEISLADVNEHAITNSAGDPFDTGIERSRSLITYNFSQYEANTVTDFDLAERNETTNSTTFLSHYPAHTLMLIVKSFEYGWYYGYDCLRVDYQMVYNKRTWKEKRIDQGYRYLESGDYKDFMAGNGAYRRLGFLNGSDGGKSETAEFLEFDKLEESNFAFIRTA